MKFFNSIKQHRVLAFFITIFIVFSIILVTFFCITPISLECIDLKTADESYCKDIYAAYEKGDDLLSYKNIVKLGEVSDSSTDKYFYSFVVDYSSFASNKSNFSYYLNTTDKLPSNLQVRKEKSNGENIKIEFFLLSSIKDPKAAARLAEVKSEFAEFNVRIPQADINDPYDTQLRKVINFRHYMNEQRVWFSHNSSVFNKKQNTNISLFSDSQLLFKISLKDGISAEPAVPQTTETKPNN